MSAVKHSLISNALRHRYWVLAVCLICLVWLGLALALCPLKDEDGSYATYPSGLMTGLENQAMDLLFQLREARRADYRNRAAGEPITLIVIDDRAVEASRTRPQKWPREWYARLIERANQGGARVIGLDIFLGDEGGQSDADRASDQRLAEAIADAGKVFLTKTLNVGGHKAQSPLPLFDDAATGTGFVEVPHDTDGFIRSVPLFVAQPGGETEFSFATQLALGYLESLDGKEHSLTTTQSDGTPAPQGTVILDGRSLPLRNDLTLQLDFRTRTPAFRQVSAADLLFNPNAQLPADLFQDRVVLIGDAYLGSQDMHSTPLAEPSVLPRLLNGALPSAPVQTPGVEIHATALTTMLFGRTPVRPRYGWQILLLVMPLALVGWAVLGLRALWGILVALMVTAAVLLISSWAFNSDGLILPLASAWVGTLLLTPIGLGLRYGHERVLREETEAERAKIMDIFARCVSPEVAEEMRRRGDQLTLINERRTVTVIFTDIRGFTAISENAEPDKLVEWLNEYFRRMNAIISAHGGFINKYMGDGLMIVFGAPIARDDGESARAAVACGLEMLAEVERINEAWRGTDRPTIKIGVGINTGKASCTVVGAERRLEYTVMGDTVNLASRLETKTKDVGEPMLISEATARLLGDEYETHSLGEVEVRGKLAKTVVFTVRARPT